MELVICSMVLIGHGFWSHLGVNENCPTYVETACHQMMDLLGIMSKLEDSRSRFNFENIRDLQLKNFPFGRTHDSCPVLLS